MDKFMEFARCVIDPTGVTGALEVHPLEEERRTMPLHQGIAVYGTAPYLPWNGTATVVVSGSTYYAAQWGTSTAQR